MKPKITLLFITLAALQILLTMCDTKTTENSETKNEFIEINIDDYKPDDVVYFSELFDDYEIIPLETKKECLMGRISCVRFCNDHIVVLDSYNSKSVFLFDLNGKFVRKIAREGKGPGEYTALSTISTNEKKGEVAIYDGSARQILIYNIDGTYIKTIPLKQSSGGSSVEILNDKIYAGYNIRPSNEHLLEIFDLEGNKIEQLIPNENKNNFSDTDMSSRSTIFSPIGNSLKYKCSSINTVFQIENNSVQPFIHLTSQKLKTESELKPSNTIEEITVTPKKFDMDNLDAGTYRLSNYIEANNISIIETKNGFVYNHFFYDSNTGKIKYTSKRNFKDDIMNRNAGASGYFLTVYKDKLVASINSGLLLKELLKKIEAGELTSEKHNLEELNENSNPCIIMYKCKPEIVLND